MPHKPKRPCNAVGCNVLTSTGYCEDHKPVNTHDNYRKSSTKRGYDYKWRKYRIIFLRRNPVCVTCRTNGYTVPATEVDHIVPHRGDKRLFWDPNNHQGLCKSCHSKKTVKGL